MGNLPMMVNTESEVVAYRSALGLDTHEKRQRAFEVAHDLRKFEIELIWKRSAYYWALQIAAFAGIATIGNSLVPSNLTNIPADSGFVFASLLHFLLALFGAITSLAWFATTMSSKVWFYNWEKHIDMLESEFCGDLYKTIYFRSRSPIFASKITKSVKNKEGIVFSLTGVNQATSLTSVLVWFVILIFSFITNFVTGRGTAQLLLVAIVSAAVLTVIFQILKWMTVSKGKQYMSELDIPSKDGKFMRRNV